MTQRDTSDVMNPSGVRAGGEDRPTILLIEDSQADARLLEARIESAFPGGSVVRHARTLAGGLAELAEGDCDVILLDLGLPDVNGLDSYRSVAHAQPEAPVVVVTGFDDERTAREAVRLGVQDYLLKDHATPEALRRAITFAIRRHELLRQALGDRSGRRRTVVLVTENHDPSIWLG
jgi:DNA-binding NarL/FixJ family response regulator